MTVLLILGAAAVWALGLLALVALCRSAALGDEWLQHPVAPEPALNTRGTTRFVAHGGRTHARLARR